jgi:hypothetical protein
MDIRSLVGKHTLFGVAQGRGTSRIDWCQAEAQITEAQGWFTSREKYADADAFSFGMDDHVYTALEDPSDGYRSQLEAILVDCDTADVTFCPIQVFATMRTTEYGGDRVLDIYDIASSLRIISVGTRNSDDYYPSFVAEWIPENMAVNRA